MAKEDDDLQPVTPDDLMLGPTFSVPEDMPEPVEEVVQTGADSTSAFDQRYREPFSGLLFLGSLKEDVVILGHKFSLQTPSQNERLEAGIIHKKYLNSISSEIAWAAIVAATYLRAVDGTPLPEPIGPAETGVRDRFNWVLDNVHGIVINKVYEQCLILDNQVNTAITELERLGES